MAGLDGLTTPDYSITDDFTGGLVKELTPEPNNNQLKLLSIVPMIAACGSFFLLVMFIFVAYDARFSKKYVTKTFPIFNLYKINLTMTLIFELCISCILKKSMI